MNWKLYLLSFSLISCFGRASIVLDAMFVENGRNLVEKTIILHKEGNANIDQEGLTISFALKDEQADGAIVTVYVTKNGSMIIDSELSMVWEREAVVQTDIGHDFVKLTCKSRMLEEQPMVLSNNSAGESQ